MNEFLSGDVAYDVWILLRRTSQVVQKARDREVSQYGISAVTAGVLFDVQTLAREAKAGAQGRGRAPDPQVGVNLNGYEGVEREELKTVILVIKDSLEENFPGVPVILRGKAKEIFQEMKRGKSMDLFNE